MRTVLFKRRKGTNELVKIDSRPFERAHTEEDLHRFLESEPSLIARGAMDGDSIPTIVVASHLRLDYGELDLLLLDGEGKITIVELKRGRTAREVIGQILDYASQVAFLGLHGLAEYGIDWDEAIERLSEAEGDSGDLDVDRLKLSLQNPRLLIVAFEVDEPTKRIAEFLRSKDIPIYCVEFKYFSDDEFEYYYPEIIGLEEVGRISEETPVQRVYRAIWQELLDRFSRERRVGVTRRTTTKKNYLSIPIGVAYAHLEWVIHGLNRSNGWFEVGLHLEHRESEKNVEALQWLESNRSRLESLVGTNLLFEKWGTRWARVYARREAPRIDKDIRDWALNTMLRFYDAVESLSIAAGLKERGW